jgi:hypothetical protein
MLWRIISTKATRQLSKGLEKSNHWCEMRWHISYGPVKKVTILARAHRLVDNVDDLGFKVLKYELRIPILAGCERCHLKFLTPSDKMRDADAAEKYLWEKYILHDCKNVSAVPRKQSE